MFMLVISVLPFISFLLRVIPTGSDLKRQNYKTIKRTECQGLYKEKMQRDKFIMAFESPLISIGRVDKNGEKERKNFGQYLRNEFI